MSCRYAILMRAGAPTSATRPEDWELRREGFAWIALAFPTLWLLVHRQWSWAALAFVLPLPFAWLVPDAYLIASIAVGVLAAFEGRERVIVSRETRGMRRVGVLEAHSQREAEDKLAALVTRGGLAMRAARAVRQGSPAAVIA